MTGLNFGLNVGSLKKRTKRKGARAISAFFSASSSRSIRPSSRRRHIRRLAKEALQKVSGELPTERAKAVAANTSKENVPTDQKLAKFREMDKKMEDAER